MMRSDTVTMMKEGGRAYKSQLVFYVLIYVGLARVVCLNSIYTLRALKRCPYVFSTLDYS